MKEIPLYVKVLLFICVCFTCYAMGREQGQDSFKSQIIAGKYVVISNVVTRVETKMVPVRTTNTFTVFSIQVPK